MDVLYGSNESTLKKKKGKRKEKKTHAQERTSFDTAFTQRRDTICHVITGKKTLAHLRTLVYLLQLFILRATIR